MIKIAVVVGFITIVLAFSASAASVRSSKSTLLACSSYRTEVDCGAKSLRCEWTGTVCQTLCSEYKSPQVCASFERCQWTQENQCESQNVFCYRWDVEEICNQYPTCLWDFDTRSCSSTVNEDETVPGNPRESVCPQDADEFACGINAFCMWTGSSCVERTNQGTEISEDDITRAPTASPTLRPTDPQIIFVSETISPTTINQEMFCNKIDSKTACESSSESGITCVFVDGRCRIPYSGVATAPVSVPSMITGSSVFWVSFSFSVAVAAVISAYVIRARLSIKPYPYTRVVRSIQFSFSIASFVLFSVAPVHIQVTVPLIFASLGCTSMTVQVIRHTRLPQWLSNALDLSMFCASLVVSAAVSKTTEASTFAGGVSVVIGFILSPWVLICFFERADNRNVTRAPVSLLVLLRATCLALASLYIGMYSSSEIASAGWISCIIAIVILPLAIGRIIAFGPDSFLVLVLEIIGSIAIIVGAIEASFYNSDIVKSVTMLGITVFWNFAIGAGVIIVKRKQTTRLGRKGSFSSQELPRRSPVKQKVFASPTKQNGFASPAKTSQNSLPVSPKLDQQYQDISTFPNGIYHETVARSRPNSAERSREEHPGHRRRTSSADYKREMAIV